MSNRDMNRRRLEGYYEGASGRRAQFDFDGPEYGRQGGSYQTFGDDAGWKNNEHTRHHNFDHFGLRSRDRGWDQHLDNYRQDERNHYGKGPKGYRRSDQRIFEDVCEALTQFPDVDARELEVRVEEGIVTLSGTVESRRMKRDAEFVAEGVLGVEDVVNLLSPKGMPRADQMKTDGSALGGNPEQESRTGSRQ
jgi:hypothetical protein